MPLTRRGLTAGLLLALASLTAATFVYGQPRYAPVAARIAVSAEPIASFDNRDSSRTRFGALEFRGGLVLSSDNAAFGGLSGLVMAADGKHFVTVSDRGSWFRGRLTYRDGRLAGIADAEVAPILGNDGKPLAERGWFDAEALTRSGGTMFVGFERVQRIAKFDYGRDGLAARGEPVQVPHDFDTLSNNRSLECLAAPEKPSPLAGSLLVITERSLDAAGNFRSFVLDGANARRFTVKRIGDFDVSDCALLGGHDLLLLERSYSVVKGVAMRIRKLSLDDIKPGAVVDGPVLIAADLGYQIDNMEGMSVHRNAAGETIVTLISDDNFSVLQRTLLLQFALVEE
jgi:hypothetical protein